MDVERRVTAEFQEAGLLLDRGALALLSEHVGRSDEDMQQLLTLAEEGTTKLEDSATGTAAIHRNRACPGVSGKALLGSAFTRIPTCLLDQSAGIDSKITEARARELIHSLQHESSDTAFIQVICAGECPRVPYDHLRRSFVLLDAAPSCFATAPVSHLHVSKTRTRHAEHIICIKPFGGSSSSLLHHVQSGMLAGTRELQGINSCTPDRSPDDGRSHLTHQAGPQVTWRQRSLMSASLSLIACHHMRCMSLCMLFQDGLYLVAAALQPLATQLESLQDVLEQIFRQGGVVGRGGEVSKNCQP